MDAVEMQNKFDNLVENDFIEIAESASDDVMKGKVKQQNFVNISYPDIMIYARLLFLNTNFCEWNIKMALKLSL